jgi:N-acetyl-gamma-glutamyl-phosphate reductase
MVYKYALRKVGCEGALSTAVETKTSKRAGAGPALSRPVVHAALIGATGYAGGELLSILARHPFAFVTRLMSSGRSGKKAFPIEEVHPKLRGRFATLCEPLDVEQMEASGCEVVFLATPHETSLQVVPALLESGLRVVDLSAAFRLKNSEAYPRWYGFEHNAPEALAEAVYGVPEFDARAIAKARLVANPGCYATSVILALAPLLRAGWVDVRAGIIADSKSGVSGAGRTPGEKYHFPEVNENLRAYGIFNHRHVPEMLQALDLAEKDFIFTPHLLPITRGILSTIYLRLSKPREVTEVEALFRKFYAAAPLVRIYPAGTLPEIQGVAHTQYADIGFALDASTGRFILVSTLDNLGKGAAGQAVQNMNLMFGFPQETGLL